MAVVTVKEPAFLLAMDRVVGRIQIQHHLLGRRFVGLHEGIHHPAVDPVRVHRDLLVPLLLIDLGAGQLQPVQRTTCPPAPSPDLRPAAASPPTDRPYVHRHRQHRIGAQLIMIVQILVPQTESVDAAAPTTPRPCVRSTADPGDP